MRCADLLEAEGRDLRQVAVRFGLGMIGALCAALLVLGGMALLLVGLYKGTEPELGPPGAALLTGVVSIVIGSGLLWAIRARIR